NYQDLLQSKDGGRAVAGARSSYNLRAADAPAEAIASGNAEVLRLALNTAPPALRRQRAPNGRPQTSTPASTTEAARQYGQQSQFAGGRTFFQNDRQWVDSLVQQQKNPRSVRVQFGSTEYFELIRKQPRSVPWLALGRNLQFVIVCAVYVIYELLLA